jgi:amino acid permease
MTACNVVIHFWSDAVPTGAVIAIVMVLYAFINVMAVKWYGETEFWAALGKMLLIIGLIIYTFITMLGEPLHHEEDTQTKHILTSQAGIHSVIAMVSATGKIQAHLHRCTMKAIWAAFSDSCSV